MAAVVDQAIEEPPSRFPRDVVYGRFRLVDGAGNRPAVLRAAIESVAELSASGLPTLVVCGAGMSHSPAIVVAVLATTQRIALTDALKQLTVGHPHDVSPGFLAEIANIMSSSRE